MEGWRAEKKRFFRHDGGGERGGAGTRARGSMWSLGGRRRGELVQDKSKSYIDTLLVVHFEGCKCYFIPMHLCTEGRGRIEGRNGDGRREGMRAAAGGRRKAIPPLIVSMVGTIRGFGMQKFFFEFWGTGFG